MPRNLQTRTVRPRFNVIARENANPAILPHPYYSTASPRNPISTDLFFQNYVTVVEVVDNRVMHSNTNGNVWYASTLEAVLVTYPTGEKYHFKYDTTVITVTDEHGIVTKRFVDKATAELNGYKFSHRLKKYMDIESPEFYGRETMLRYHSGARHNAVTNPDHVWKVGIEIEKEDPTQAQNGLAWKLFEETGWAKEADSSLGHGGYELVSPVMPLYDYYQIQRHCKQVQNLINAQDSDRCGGHFNISCEGFTNVEILEKIKPFVTILYSLYKHRTRNHFCQVRPFARYTDGTKYSAIHLKGNEVLEIRLFPAIKSVSNLLWRVWLMQILFGVKNSKGTNAIKTFSEYIKMMLNPKSGLHAHLRKVFTYEQVIAKAKLAVEFYESDSTLVNADELRKAKAILASAAPAATPAAPRTQESQA